MQEVYEASRMRAYRLAAPLNSTLTLASLAICICLILEKFAPTRTHHLLSY